MNNPVVVVGSGISGLNFALNVAEFRDVLVLTKKETCESSTNYAQGGIAAVLDRIDSFDKHIEDTMNAGSSHNNLEAVEFMVKKGPESIARLIDFGVNFETYDGKIALTREGGHSESRIAFKGDYTGKEIEDALVKRVNEHDRIEVIEHAFCTDLELNEGMVVGVYYIHNGEMCFAASDAVVLATGGAGQVFKYTTNPDISTGDGVAMAYLAGAEIRDMEFVQFHPTAFYPDNGRPFLISESLRGEGATLKNEKGERFVDEVAPRDQVALAIYEELKKGQVYLDMTHEDEEMLKSRFPFIYSSLKEYGLNLAEDLIPIRPAAHYLCGGIEVFFKGRSSVPRLYSFGETAHTGVHGANRLASNSLLEALVFSTELADELEHVGVHNDLSNDYKAEYEFNQEIDLDSKIQDLKDLMWQSAGVVRDFDSLQIGLSKIEDMQVEHSENATDVKAMDLKKHIIYRNMLIVARLIIEAALERPESLGCHTMR